MRARIRQPQRKSMPDAGGAADNDGGFALQIKKGRTHEGTVFLRRDRFVLV